MIKSEILSLTTHIHFINRPAVNHPVKFCATLEFATPRREGKESIFKFTKSAYKFKFIMLPVITLFSCKLLFLIPVSNFKRCKLLSFLSARLSNAVFARKRIKT